MVEASCPKCGTSRRPADEAACSKCGLSAARMETFAKERDEAVPDVLTNAWERALEAWDDIARHDELIRLVSQHDAFAWAAARYRTRSDEIGKRQLERVRKAAEVTMMSSAAVRKGESTPSPYRATRLMLIALVLIVAGGLVYAMVIRNRGATPTPPSVTPSTN